MFLFELLNLEANAAYSSGFASAMASSTHAAGLSK